VSNAKIIAYADPSLGGSSSILVAELMNSLDITGSIGPKTKLVPPAKPLLDLVAGGGVDFGFNPISEILTDPRVELVGPLPAAIQKYTLYVASLVQSSRQPEAFKALVAFLSSPETAAVLKTKGFEPF
jgi:molybdate transport system substrate-binding protein